MWFACIYFALEKIEIKHLGVQHVSLNKELNWIKDSLTTVTL